VKISVTKKTTGTGIVQYEALHGNRSITSGNSHTTPQEYVFYRIDVCVPLVLLLPLALIPAVHEADEEQGGANRLDRSGN
jgi:hypothetical protein